MQQKYILALLLKKYQSEIIYNSTRSQIQNIFCNPNERKLAGDAIVKRFNVVFLVLPFYFHYILHSMYYKTYCKSCFFNVRVLIHTTNKVPSQLLASTFILWLLALKLDVIKHYSGFVSNNRKCNDICVYCIKLEIIWTFYFELGSQKSLENFVHYLNQIIFYLGNFERNSKHLLQKSLFIPFTHKMVGCDEEVPR